MKTILKAFANNSLQTDFVRVPPNSDYARFIKKFSDYEKELLSLINEQEKNLFEQLSNTHEELLSLTATDRFIQGYRLGVLMTIEVYAGRDSLL